MTRVDNNANAFVVRDELRVATARALTAELEARGRKQTDWVNGLGERTG